MDIYEKLLLFMESQQLINKFENNHEIMQGYLLEIKQKRAELYQKLGRIINKNAEQYYDESSNFRFYNPQENELYEILKHNNEASFMITFINYDEPLSKVVKFQVPFSTLKIINNKNEEQPVDIICEFEGKCTLYLFIKLDGWSETSVKLIPSKQKQQIYPLNNAGKIGFWNDLNSLELAINAQTLKYKHCKKIEDNIQKQKRVLLNINNDNNNDYLNEITQGLQDQVQTELEKHGINLDSEIKNDIIQGVFNSIIGRMKEQGQKIKDQAEKSVQSLKDKTFDVSDQIKQRLGRFILVAIKSEVYRNLEARALIKEKNQAHQLLKKQILNSIEEIIQKQELNDKLSDQEQKQLQTELYHEILNKIDIQEWVMTEKIIDKMEAKTGEKIDDKQRSQIGTEVNKELIQQTIGKGMKDLQEKIEFKINGILQNKKNDQENLNNLDELQLGQQDQKETEQEQQKESLNQNKDDNKNQSEQQVTSKDSLYQELKISKKKILNLKNDLVLLKKEKQKLMMNGQKISNNLVEEILQKEQNIQELSDNMRTIEKNIETKKTEKQQESVNNKYQKIKEKVSSKKIKHKLENIAEHKIKEEKQLKEIDSSQVLANTKSGKVDVEQELKEEEFEKKEEEINELKSKLSVKEQQYETQVKTVEELREEINQEKNRLLEEERELKIIQMGKLSERMENEKNNKSQLLKTINKLGNLKLTMKELQEKEQEVQKQISLFTKFLHSKHNEEEVIQDEEDTSKHAFEILNNMMGHMEEEEESMATDQETLTILENQIEQEKNKLSQIVRQKETNLIQIQTQRDKLQQKINKLPKGNYHSFLETSKVINDQYVCLEESFKLNFMEYNCQNNQKCSDQTYFRPQGLPTEIFDTDPEIIFYQGQVVSQIIINSNGMKNTLTIYKDLIDLDFIEVESTTAKIHFEDENIQTKEVVLTITSDEISNDKTFITDSNGYFLNKHQRINENDLQKQIPFNYYPASLISIQDQQSKISMNVNLQESIGVASQKEGQIELMFNRMLKKTQIPANFTFALSFNDNSSNFPNNIRKIEKQIKTQPLRFFTETSNPVFNEDNKPLSHNLDLPQYIKLQFRQLKKNQILVHLSNLNEVSPYEIQLFESYTNSISNIFCKLTGMMIKFSEIQETTLSGNQEISQMIKNQFDWEQNDKQVAEQDVAEGLIKLMPMQTRTFLFKF